VGGGVVRHAFKQVDVFTARPFEGNPVAVVLDADDVDDAAMQRVAAWTNLSETTFVLRPTSAAADYRLRIFTPAHEIPFAGHPTIGSAHAILEVGGFGRERRTLTQECAAGLLPLTVEDDGGQRRIFVRVPEPRVARECDGARDAILGALRARFAATPAPLAIAVGPVWLVVRLETPEAVGRLAPDLTAVAALSRELELSGITVFALGGQDDTAVRVRSFAPAGGVPEDPVCGSGNAAVAAFLALTGLIRETGPTYVASQGTELGRRGRVFVRVRAEGREIEIGGAAVTAVDGHIEC
jgi:PhzF family phenazine biosynthesis protein